MISVTSQAMIKELLLILVYTVSLAILALAGLALIGFKISVTPMSVAGMVILIHVFNSKIIYEDDTDKED